jgi:hypothetical protein
MALVMYRSRSQNWTTGLIGQPRGAVLVAGLVGAAILRLVHSTCQTCPSPSATRSASTWWRTRTISINENLATPLARWKVYKTLVYDGVQWSSPKTRRGWSDA